MNHATSTLSTTRIEPSNGRSDRRPRGGASAPTVWRLSALLTTVLALSPFPALAVNCTPDSITLSSQSEVDDFQADHGPCDQVVGTLTITGTSITNLDGLAGLHALGWTEITNTSQLTDISGLSTVFSFNGPFLVENNSLLADLNGLSGMTAIAGGALFIRNNLSLSDLSGLSNLTSIGASLAIDNNDMLVNLDALSSLTSVASNISVVYNDGLTSVTGLSGITGFTASLTIRDNPLLSSLDGLGGSTELNGLVIDNNDSLTDLDALSGLTSIGNGYSSLFIDDNDSLLHLDGLADLVSLDADVEITDNPSLGSCKGLVFLLDQIDDALPGPGPGTAGIPDVNGDVILLANQDSCNSVAAILAQLIFRDGFESASTSAWGATNP